MAISRPTLEFSRLRVSKTAFKAKVRPQPQPITKNGRVAIRLQRFVGQRNDAGRERIHPNPSTQSYRGGEAP